MAEVERHTSSDLMALARDRAANSRRRLLENMTDLFLSTDARLSERERALMEEIIVKLVHEMEMQVRSELAERLAAADAAPHELIVLLANDAIEIARPVLQRSRLLQDTDLVEIVRQRTQEHRLAVAARDGLSETVSQALIDFGDDQVVETLIANRDAIISRQAIEYLVEESRRVDRFQQPLLQRPDLPADLANRMFWWVSAGLREAILTSHPIDEMLLDELLEESAAAVALRPGLQQSDAEKLAVAVTERGAMGERYVLQNLRSGHVLAAIAGLAKMAGADLATVRRVAFDPGGEALAACCKAADLSRSGFAAVFLLTREAQEGGQIIEPGRVEAMMQLYDNLDHRHARATLRLWMREDGYRDAVNRLNEGSAATTKNRA
ncbi:MAG TPA: DUF2336 domain-containing protein [Candidatus Sulfotelmatobacter sp.]|nr:DUF2336 domain-containing protein [Candidatus Sulfotelmatobacter sp.]